jgi:hypothetical protein
MVPGRVESYSSSSERASVKPLIGHSFIDESGEYAVDELPVITDVLVVFFGAGLGRIVVPVAKGDLVLLIMAESSIDKWKPTGGAVKDPGDLRRHSLSDAIAIPWGTKGLVEPTFKAIQFMTAMATFISAVATAAAGVGGGVTAAINAAFTTFQTQIDALAKTETKIS